MPSKLARKLSGALFTHLVGQEGDSSPEELETVIDAELENIRKSYEAPELSRCPIVSHHSDPCAFCITAAMRELILVTQGE